MNAETGRSIVLTGATGFLGAFLMADLLQAGYQLTVLGRASKDMGLAGRLSRLVRWFGIADPGERLCACEADFSQKHFGLDDKAYGRLCTAAEKVIHCASDTSFAERNRGRVMAANVSNLTALLGLAADARTGHLYYISTAYAAGAREGICLEAPITTDRFTNVYEESKAQAENIIAAFCEENAILLTMIRPAIVFGDSRTGRSLKFNALYFPIKSIQYIRDIYLNDLKNNGGGKSRERGIFVDAEGYLNLPLRIYLPQPGAINLVPVDYFVRATRTIIEKNTSGGIFHVTHNAPTSLETIAAYNQEFMKIKGIEIVYGMPGSVGTRNPAEELFDRFIEPYRPYLSDNRIFDRVNTDLATDNLHPPEFTGDIFNNCMKYATSVNWGESIFTEE